MYKVRKNDGVEEDFDKNKILSGCMKSGASIDEAEKVATGVETWLPQVATNGVVASTDIKIKVIELLRGANPNAAASFEGYKKVL
ncbi:MAG: ATP cone domain-containing protein [Candidatus Microgenomates bacterium]|jgi:transcriptional regulator NrdR family protein